MIKIKEGEILALIPARSGSKAVKDKNIRLIDGKPMMAYSIEVSLASDMINRTIVSTDSPEYAEIAKKYGAEVPFLRPKDISQDCSTDLEAFTHALDWLKDNEGYVPEICVHLRPTYPIRNFEDINNCIKILRENPHIDSVRSISVAMETPFKMWFRNNDGFLKPVVKMETIKEPYNVPRQLLPPVFAQNACIDVVRTSVITKKKSMTGSNIFGYIMENNFDIDTEQQLRNVESQLKKYESTDKKTKNPGNKTFCFDVDGVIATIVPNNQYDLAKPINENIEWINMLYEQGNRILLFTARGSKTGIDWTETTKQQLGEWNVKYHQLLFGKPAADYYVDDKMLSVEELKKLANSND